MHLQSGSPQLTQKILKIDIVFIGIVMSLGIMMKMSVFLKEDGNVLVIRI
jgi:hypothetical protein